MRSPLRAAFVLAAFGGSCLWGASAQSAAAERSDGPWAVLARNVKDVLVGPGGKCFYMTDGEAAAKLSVSADGIVAPGFQPLLFDRTGRLWCLRRGTNSIHGLKGDSLITLRPPKGAVFEVRGSGWFVSAYEDSAGRVWFGNSRGVQWFDGKKWASKDLADRRGIELGRLMTPLAFAEDDKGRLFLSAPVWGGGTCGTRGIWAFDGKTWSAYTAQDLLPSNEIQAVCPAGRDMILVNSPGRLIALNVGQSNMGDEAARLIALLNDEQWKVREQATADLKKLGGAISLDLKRHMTQTEHPEVRSRIKMVLDALRSPAPKRQPLPGGRYTCEFVHVRAPRWRRRPAGRAGWLAWALNVVDTKTGKMFKRATVLLTSDSTRLIDGWPVRDGSSRLTTILPDGKGGLWIGVAGRGLHHWDGEKTTRISTIAKRRYWIIRGFDNLGRVMLGSGLRVAAYGPANTKDSPRRPQRPQRRK